MEWSQSQVFQNTESKHRAAVFVVLSTGPIKYENNHTLTYLLVRRSQAACSSSDTSPAQSVAYVQIYLVQLTITLFCIPGSERCPSKGVGADCREDQSGGEGMP